MPVTTIDFESEPNRTGPNALFGFLSDSTTDDPYVGFPTRAYDTTSGSYVSFNSSDFPSHYQILLTESSTSSGSYSASVPLAAQSTQTYQRVYSVSSLADEPLGAEETSSTPPPSIIGVFSISPASANIAGGSSLALSAVVFLSDSTTRAATSGEITWSKISGPGSIDATTGLITAPAATSTVQTSVYRASLASDSSAPFVNITVTVPALSNSGGSSGGSSGSGGSGSSFNGSNGVYTGNSPSGTIKRIKGYRPIEVTLTFRDGSKALPDSLGIPRTGVAYSVGPEILRPATNEQRIQRQNVLKREAQQSGTEIAILPVQVFVTSERPLLYASRGASIRLYWHTEGADIPSSGDVAIAPTKVIVDSQLGLVEITEAPPSGKTSVLAYYYTTLSEKSSRGPQSEWDDLSATQESTSQGFSSALGLSQVYPVTRNRTDYVYGRPVTLTLPNLERSSPDYYPVYEYYVLPDGTLQFSVPFHPYSDQPATIQVRYQTLGIEPRLIVDIARDSDIGISPEIPPVSLAVESITS